MGKNRDRLSIIADILDVAMGGSSKTRIMSHANLSYSLLEKYLTLALKSGFIELVGYKYHLTDQGKNFLRVYRHFEDRYLKAQKMIESLDCERNQLSQSFERSARLPPSVNSIIDQK